LYAKEKRHPLLAIVLASQKQAHMVLEKEKSLSNYSLK
jgi:hypothetical protein